MGLQLTDPYGTGCTQWHFGDGPAIHLVLVECKMPMLGHFTGLELKLKNISGVDKPEIESRNVLDVMLF